MLHTILVPLDASEHARQVIPFVCTLAKRSAARVILLQAVGDDALLDHAETVLERIENDLHGQGIHANRTACTAEPVATIMEMAQSIQVDLIAMATSRSSDVDRWLNGSTSDDVMRHVSVPILLVPAAAVHAWPDGTRLSILVALDGSTLAERVLEPAGVLARVLDAEIVLIRIVDGPERLPAAPESTYLEAVARKLRGQGLVVRTRLAAGHPSTAIARVADEEGVHLIAMATHGRVGLTRLVFGSIATATLQHANVPLLLVPSAYPPRPISVTASASVLAGNGPVAMSTVDSQPSPGHMADP
jgi:nucleotide-binding universal stress UspA family protein